MLIPGRLAGTTLGDVLGALHRSGATGTLELVERPGPRAGRTHRIFLSGGLVAAVDTCLGSPRLGEILHAEGFLDRASVARLDRLLLVDSRKKAGELLVHDGLVSPRIVDAALRHQVRARLDVLFRLADADVRFHLLAKKPSIAERIVPLSPHEFLRDRPRARHARTVERSPTGATDGATTGTPPPASTLRTVSSERARAFGVLGLDAGADREAVQRAFRRLAARAHPDRFPGATPSERADHMRRFAEISAAYHALVA